MHQLHHIQGPSGLNSVIASICSSQKSVGAASHVTNVFVFDFDSTLTKGCLAVQTRRSPLKDESEGDRPPWMRWNYWSLTTSPFMSLRRDTPSAHYWTARGLDAKLPIGSGRDISLQQSRRPPYPCLVGFRWKGVHRSLFRWFCCKCLRRGNAVECSHVLVRCLFGRGRGKNGCWVSQKASHGQPADGQRSNPRLKIQRIQDTIMWQMMSDQSERTDMMRPLTQMG